MQYDTCETNGCEDEAEDQYSDRCESCQSSYSDGYNQAMEFQSGYGAHDVVEAGERLIYAGMAVVGAAKVYQNFK